MVSLPQQAPAGHELSPDTSYPQIYQTTPDKISKPRVTFETLPTEVNDKTNTTTPADEIQYLPTREFIAPRWCYLQTMRTECYTFHTQLFQRVYFIDELIKMIDERMDLCAEAGIKMGANLSYVNSMQQLFVDVMGLLDIAELIVTLQLAPGFEQWYTLYTIASKVTPYCGRGDWKRATCSQFTEIVLWRNLALEVFDFGVKSIQLVGDLVCRIEQLANYEGITIGVGSIWPSSF